MVVIDPKVRAGRPVVAGTGIQVSDLAAHHHAAGMTPEELAVEFNLDLDQVHGALAYYYQRQEEIDAELRANAEEAEHWRQVLTSQNRCVTLD